MIVEVEKAYLGADGSLRVMTGEFDGRVVLLDPTTRLSDIIPRAYAEAWAAEEAPSPELVSGSVYVGGDGAVRYLLAIGPDSDVPEGDVLFMNRSNLQRGTMPLADFDAWAVAELAG